jgi:phage terminase large subunit
VIQQCWIDKTSCARLLACLASYNRDYDAKHREYGKNPVHDWSSHSADAMRYLALSIEDEMYSRRPREVTCVGMHEPIFLSSEQDSVY